MIKRLLLVCTLLSAAPLAAARPQGIHGRVTDQQGGASIAAALVTLVDSAGKRIDAGMTDAAGAYGVHAGHTGTYSLIVERLGYETFRTSTFVLESNLIRDLELPPTALELPTIVATAEGHCDQSMELSRTASLLWDEVQKSLAMAKWSDLHTVVNYETEEHNRVLSPDGNFQRSDEHTIVTSTTNGTPYASLDPDSLLRYGFIQTADDSVHFTYWGMDGELIQTPEFRRTHCFEATTDRKKPELVGLRFTPNGIIKSYDVKGVLWLDRRSFELKKVEFTYASLPVHAPKGSASGEISFTRLPSGIWIINEWSMRVPLMSTRPDGRQGSFVMGLREVAKRVLSAYVDNRLVYRASDSK